MGRRAVTAEKRMAVLDRGLAVLHRQGYHATSIDDLVAAADIPKGSFYNYFSDKEGFALEAVRHYTLMSLEFHARFLNDPDLTPKDRVVRLFKGMADHNIRVNRFGMGCLLGNLALELSDGSDLIRKEIWNSFLEIRKGIAVQIRLGHDAGEIPLDRTAEELADTILDAWQGALLRMKVEKSGRPLKRFSRLLALLLSQSKCAC
jgi:TetR/AcrR family transcriptional repressor of nem operon